MSLFLVKKPANLSLVPPCAEQLKSLKVSEIQTKLSEIEHFLNISSDNSPMRASLESERSLLLSDLRKLQVCAVN